MKPYLVGFGIGLLLAAVLSLPLFFGFTNNGALVQDPRIESLEHANDSLDALLAQRPKADTFYITLYRKATAKTDSAKAEVNTLAPTEQVMLFARKTGTDSIPMLPDTTAKVTMATIKTANLLFVEGEGNAEKVFILGEHLASKDTTIRMQAERIVSADSLDTVKTIQHKADVSALKSEVKQERRGKVLYQVTTGLAGLLLIISMFI